MCTLHFAAHRVPRPPLVVVCRRTCYFLWLYASWRLCTHIKWAAWRAQCLHILCVYMCVCVLGMRGGDECACNILIQGIIHRHDDHTKRTNKKKHTQNKHPFTIWAAQYTPFTVYIWMMRWRRAPKLNAPQTHLCVRAPGRRHRTCAPLAEISQKLLKNIRYDNGAAMCGGWVNSAQKKNVCAMLHI